MVIWNPLALKINLFFLVLEAWGLGRIQAVGFLPSLGGC